jgi:hypothetical protein
MSIRDPIKNTPLIPAFENMFGKKKKSKPAKISHKHVNGMAKKLSVKISGKSRRKLWADIVRKSKCVLKQKKKNQTPKSKKMKTYLMKHIPKMAKQLKIKMAGKTKCALLSQIDTRMKKQIPKKVSRKSNFGSWWDNTQKTYSGSKLCASNQCASTSDMGGSYPFYQPSGSNWRPYTPVTGINSNPKSGFGRRYFD